MLYALQELAAGQGLLLVHRSINRLPYRALFMDEGAGPALGDCILGSGLMAQDRFTLAKKLAEQHYSRYQEALKALPDA